MTTNNPHGCYDWCCNLTDFDGLVLAQDFECQLDVSCDTSCGDLEVYCTDVLIDGVSLRNGGALAKLIRTQVMAKANDEIENGGWLWDQVREAEGLSLTGHAGDPDTRWLEAAE